MKRLPLVLLLMLVMTLGLSLAACESDDDDDRDSDDDDDDSADDDQLDDDEGCPDADLDNLGYDEGDTMADWTLTNDQGEEVSLYDRYCGQIMVILVGQGNCPYCGQEAEAFPDYYDTYHDQGVDFVVIMGADFSGSKPDEEFLQKYKKYHELDDIEVLADPYFKVTGSYFPENAVPMTIFLRRDMEIGYIVLGWSDGMIGGKIKRMLVEDE